MEERPEVMDDVDLQENKGAGEKKKGKKVKRTKEEEEEEEEEVSPIKFETETYFSLVKRKTRSFFRNITLEPVMLLYGVVG